MLPPYRTKLIADVNTQAAGASARPTGMAELFHRGKMNHRRRERRPRRSAFTAVGHSAILCPWVIDPQRNGASGTTLPTESVVVGAVEGVMNDNNCKKDTVRK